MPPKPRTSVQRAKPKSRLRRAAVGATSEEPLYLRIARALKKEIVGGAFSSCNDTASREKLTYYFIWAGQWQKHHAPASMDPPGPGYEVSQ